MRSRLKVELGRGAPAADLDVLGLIGADRHAFVRRVGRREQQIARVGIDQLALGIQHADAVVDAADRFLGVLSLVGLARLHEHADRLGRLVALCLQPLDLADKTAPLFVQREERVDVPVRAAVEHGGPNRFGVLSDETSVEHDGLPGGRIAPL